MKKPQLEQLHIDRIRLSSTQADGDSHSSLRQPDADDQLPTSVSKSGLHVCDPQQQQQQQQQQKIEEKNIGLEQSLPVSGTSKHHGSRLLGYLPWGTRAGDPAVSRSDSSSSTNNNDSRNRHSADTLTPPVSSASKSAAADTVEKAWPGPVLEGPGTPSPLPEASAPSGLIEKDAVGEGHHASTLNTTDYQGTQDVNQNVDQNGVADGGSSEDSQQDPERGMAGRVATLARSFLATARKILLYSWLNLLLVFVPVGIAAHFAHLSVGAVFALNAIAIVPLAGLLAFATESVAHRMGDSIGALLNITFGNAVELIILIALVKNEIRIVQASLLGSILSNLLLILGMGFLLGGLRYREQIYNSTITQMSACLLSLSVISLVLPVSPFVGFTAFHASFSDSVKADEESLKISRGTSVILLLVYGIYLLFQLKSHAYMYESTPQYIIDEESTPGPVAAWLDSSSSDDSSSSSSDSDGSGHSRSTMKKRVRRVIRGGRRRKSSVVSLDTTEGIFGGPTRTPSFGTAMVGNDGLPMHQTSVLHLATMDINEEVIDEDDTAHSRHKKRNHRHSLRRHRHKSKKLSRTGSNEHDFVDEHRIPEAVTVAQKQGNWKHEARRGDNISTRSERNGEGGSAPARGETRHVDFAFSGPEQNVGTEEDGCGNTATAAELSARPAFNLRAMSLRPVAKSLTPTVFKQAADGSAALAVPSGPIPRVRYGIRRTNSLPDRLNHMQFRSPGAMLPSQISASRIAALSENKDGANHDEEGLMLSRRAAVVLLLIVTALVAVCAEFMVDSINGLVETSSIGEVFIGLIILPIVSNAAEHVTAVTCALHNKVDLAIGVAVGSSIQIALFTTPLVVIIGWIMERKMTLYFTLFETVCLFVSAFIVNFLVLDGRSNYLEGALLCATYVIISLVAFYYPNAEEASVWGR